MTKIGVTGHQNLPPGVVPRVRARIEAILADLSGDIIGITSLAAGADQLFARMVVDRGGRLHAIVPCADYESTFTEARTLASFRELLAAAAAVETLPHPRPSPKAFLEAGQRVVDLADRMIAVWDGKDAQGPGGTADIVRYARNRSRDMVNVWPTGEVR